MTKNELLQAVANECMMDLMLLDIPYREDVTFSINTRAKARFGQCCHRGSRVSINIMSELVDKKYMDGLKNTIIHELLHTCPSCQNHGTVWKQYAAKVKSNLGFNIKRCSSRAEKGLPEKEIKTEYKYVFVCEDCGTEIKRQRKPKWFNLNTMTCDNIIHASDNGKIKIKSIDGIEID